VAVAALWASGYAVARAHGVGLPPPSSEPLGPARILDAAVRAARAALGLEDLPAPIPGGLLTAYAAVFAFAAWRAIRERDLRLATMVLVATGLVFLAGIVPLARLLPDWNAWRAWVPALALGAGATFALAAIDRTAAVGLVAVRLIALLLAPAPLDIVAQEAPVTDSHTSYLRLVRLERIVRSTRHALSAGYPTLPHGAVVRFWNLPRLAEVGFNSSSALRVWYGDSTLTWERFGGVANLDARTDALVEYRDLDADPANAIEPDAFHAYLEGGRALLAGRRDQGREWLERALQTRTRGPMHASTLFHLAMLALDRHDIASMEALRAAYVRDHLPGADLHAIDAGLAMLRGDRLGAYSALQRCLAIDPGHTQGRELMKALEADLKNAPR
jgi:hypothetical protein